MARGGFGEKVTTIREHSQTFGGSLNDDECRKLAGISRNTYYKYKREIKEEM